MISLWTPESFPITNSPLCPTAVDKGDKLDKILDSFDEHPPHTPITLRSSVARVQLDPVGNQSTPTILTPDTQGLKTMSERIPSTLSSLRRDHGRPQPSREQPSRIPPPTPRLGNSGHLVGRRRAQRPSKSSNMGDLTRCSTCFDHEGSIITNYYGR